MKESHSIPPGVRVVGTIFLGAVAGAVGLHLLFSLIVAPYLPSGAALGTALLPYGAALGGVTGALILSSRYSQSKKILGWIYLVFGVAALALSIITATSGGGPLLVLLSLAAGIVGGGVFVREGLRWIRD